MGGIYDNVVDRLRPLPIENASHQARVDLVKHLFNDGSIVDLAEGFLAQRDKKDVIEEHLKECNLYLEAYKQLIAERFSDQGVRSIDLEEAGYRVTLNREPKAAVKNKEAFRLWCIDEGLERELTLPWATTNTLVKEKLLEIVGGEGERPAFVASSSEGVYDEGKSQAIGEVLPGVEAFVITKLSRRKT